jgi:hypothetical protein
MPDDVEEDDRQCRYLPSPADIAQATAAIRSTWDETEYYARAHADPHTAGGTPRRRPRVRIKTIDPRSLHSPVERPVND